MKLFAILTVLLLAGDTANTQVLQAGICGIYVSPGGLYEQLQFDGKGRATISGGLKTYWRDYFQYNDTLVVYPDKDVFRFKVLPNGKLEGISRWVKGGSWERKPGTVACNGKDSLPLAKLRMMYAFEHWMLRMESRQLDDGAIGEMMIELKQLCDSGYGRACNRAGMMLLFTKGNETARSTWQKGCDLGDATSCKTLADTFKEEKNIAKARPLYDKACRLGDGEACSWDFEERLKKRELPAKTKRH